jgi:hypothetical protein
MQFRGAAALLLLLLPATRAAAQGGAGTIEGVATSAEDGTPLPFALVRLLPAESPAGAAPPTPLQQRITSAEGRFRLVDVPAGDYRLQLARIGYRPVLTPALRVRAGETLRHEIRGTTQVVQLAPVTVRSEGSCLRAAQLADEPRLAELWNEARKGLEIRRAFERQYRFAYVQRQDVAMQWRIGKTSRRVRVDTTVSEPDSVIARDRRRQSENRARGYARGGGNQLVAPNEKELLDDEFLRDHCLETAIAEEEGALGLRFRPVESRRDRVAIRGTIWVDAASYLVRRLEFAYLDGGRPYAEVRLDYGDVAVGGSALRLPTGGRATIRVRGAQAALLSRGEATLAYTYGTFEPARDR